jgi:hypothetical protein
MSFPTIPNINPSITLTRENAIDLLLASIAFEELGLAHVINAEAEKIQAVLGTLEGGPRTVTSPSLEDLLKIDASVDKVLNTVIKQEMLLLIKLENVMEIPQYPDQPE